MHTFQPAYRLVLDEQDLTSSVASRLQSLNLTLCREKEADQLDITLNDHDGLLDLPRRGVSLSVALGWQESGTIEQGCFTVDEIEYSSAPDLMTIRARSASMTGPMNERREKSWHRVSVEDIVRTIAARYQLTPKIGHPFKAIALHHIDQTHESDLSFLTRLAHRYDAVMTVKQHYLLFMPIGASRTMSGEDLPLIALSRKDLEQYRYHVAQRESYAGVRAYWHHFGMAQRQSVLVGGENRYNLKVLSEQYATQAQAHAAATAEWQRIQRSQATLSMTLALGRADCFPEMPVSLSGLKPEIDETPWLIARVSHTLAEQGYTTTLECEVQDDPASKRHRRQLRQKRAH